MDTYLKHLFAPSLKDHYTEPAIAQHFQAHEGQLLRVPAEHRLDPRNGIALNALHDRAFDCGLITFDEHLRLVCSSSLRDHYASATVAANFQAYEGKPLAIPAEAAGPRPEYLEHHRRNVFARPLP